MKRYVSQFMDVDFFLPSLCGEWMALSPPPMGFSYLTKWVEAVSYSSLTKKVVQKFLNKERICRSRLHSLPLIERRKNGTGSSERNESKGKG